MIVLLHLISSACLIAGNTMNPAILITGLVLLQVLTTQASCPPGCTSCSNGSVRCPGAGLTAPPSSLPKDTQTIDLTQNSITDIDRLPKLAEVQSFRMSMNQLKVIKGNTFENMPSLVSLDLSMNMITKVYKHGFRGLDNVMSISLSGNQISDIGIIFRNTPLLTNLRMGNNEIDKLTAENFKTNSMIKMLDLSNNKITKIHGNTFKNLDMLRYLILSNNPITTITDLTFSSTMLSLADFTNCELTSVPKTMPPSLVDYRLGNNMIDRINVEDFENITSLKMLTLNDNKISHVDYRSFKTLLNLKELWLSRNDLVYIPRGLPKGLQKLFMDNNAVVELEQMLFQPKSELIELILERNKISKIHTEALKDVQKLQKLDLQGNDISVIESGTFTRVPSLDSLTLSDNPIKQIENGAFSNLQSLTEISLSYVDSSSSNPENLLLENIFATMPNLTFIDMMSSPRLTKALLKLLQDKLGKSLEHLKKLNIQYNEIVTLPEELKAMLPNVKQVLLDGNLLACDRKILWLNEWMRSSEVSFHQYDAITCNSPESIKGRKVRELHPGAFGEPEDPVKQQQQQPTDPATEVTRTEQAAYPRSDSQAVAAPDARPQPQPETQPQPQRTVTGTGGTVVRIKAPQGSVSTNTGSSTVGGSNPTRKLTKKELRKLEKQRRRREKEERKRRKQRARRNKNSNDDEAKRKKRRINKAKNCKKDAEGNEKCERRKKKCTVLEDGTVRCKKRKTKKSKLATSNQEI